MMAKKYQGAMNSFSIIILDIKNSTAYQNNDNSNNVNFIISINHRRSNGLHH
jgi:hypothetical protein